METIGFIGSYDKTDLCELISCSLLIIKLEYLAANSCLASAIIFGSEFIRLITSALGTNVGEALP